MPIEKGSNDRLFTTYNFIDLERNADLKVYVEAAIDFKLYGQNRAKGTIYSQGYLKAEG